MKFKDWIFLALFLIFVPIGAFIGYLIGVEILNNITLIGVRDLAIAYILLPIIGGSVVSLIIVGIYEKIRA